SPGNDRISYGPDAVGVCDHDWAVEKAGVVHPVGAGHFAVAVEAEIAGEDLVLGVLPAWQDRSHPGANWPDTHFEGTAAGNESCVAHLNSGNVGDGIERTGSAIERNAQVAGARLRLRG